MIIEKGTNFRRMPRGGFAKRLRARLPISPRTIRIPVHMVETINKYMQILRRLVQELGRDPLPEEIAAEMGFGCEQNSLHPKNFSRDGFPRNFRWRQ